MLIKTNLEINCETIIKLYIKIINEKKFITTLMSIIPCILMAQSTDPNIDVNLEYPAYGVNIKTNFAWQDGIWARGYRISNHNNTEYFIHFGAMGTFSNGISKQNYAYIGKDWNQTYMIFQPRVSNLLS